MNLLLVTYEFPPKGGVAVQRVLKTARYLAEANWRVTVLTVEDPPVSIADPGLLGEVPSSVRVLRAWSHEPTRLIQRLKRRRAGSRVSAVAGDTPVAGGARGYSGLPPWLIRIVQSFFVPDEKLGWTGPAVRAGAEAAASAQFDIILASGPPFTALGIARRLSRRLGIPYVADLRDPIVGGYFFRPLTLLHRWLFVRYERRIVRTASAVIVATEGMRQDLVRRYPDRDRCFVTVTNGFDPEEFRATADGQLRPGFVVSYVGTFQGTIRPDAFLQAWKQARLREPGLAADGHVVFAGPLDDGTALAIENADGVDWVERTGFLPHSQAIAEMCSATVLLLVLGPEQESGNILTGKLPEYLAAGKPVLALVPQGVAADVVREADAGVVVHPEDIDGIAQAILTMYHSWREGTLAMPNPDVVARFDRRRLVGRVADVLSGVLERGSCR